MNQPTKEVQIQTRIKKHFSSFLQTSVFWSLEKCYKHNKNVDFKVLIPAL